LVFIEAFTLGLAYGFGPCTTTCAPVLVPIVMSTSRSTMQGMWAALILGAGRIFAYIALGMVFAFMGRTLNLSFPDYVIGLLFLLLGIVLLLKLHTRCFVHKKAVTGYGMCFVAGLLMGFSPCAPMLGMLAIAAKSGSVLQGALIALSFGLATIISPILIIGLIAGKWSTLKEFQRINNYVSGIFLIVLSLFYFF
jgi:sulfite exporter TauE/SafE